MKLGPFQKGMNNKAHSHDLPEGTARNAVNTDFDSRGNGTRRGGSTKIYSGFGLRDAYSCDIGTFFIEGNLLKELNSDDTATTIYTGVTRGIWDNFAGTLYFTDAGSVNLKITSAGVTEWGMEVPASPLLSATSGTFIAGKYLAACCWVDTNGVESGASRIVSINLSDDQGIVFSNLPEGESQAAYLRLYLSTANGKELYHVADISVGTATYSVLAGNYDNANVLDNHFISPPPPGRIIGHYRGRMYIADDDGYVWYSEPMSFDQFNLKDNFLIFPDAVDVMLPVTSGIFFAHGNQTDFYFGTPEDGFEIVTKLPYGGVYGSGGRVPNSDNVAWQSQRGLVIGFPDGQCKNTQEENVAVESAVSAATLIREENGQRHHIASLNQPTTSPLAADSWVAAEEIRRG